MDLFYIITTGVGLAMDACVLTISNCTVYKNSLSRKKEWSMPIAFAIFQGLMPLIGYLIGSLFASYIESVSGYLTAGVFYILFAKIVFDIIKDAKEDKSGKIESPKNAEFTFGMLIAQAVATSIDALLIGMVMSLGIEISIVLAVLIIAAITFVFVSLAMIFGKVFGKFFGKYAPYFGGAIMFILATKTLIDAII